MRAPPRHCLLCSRNGPRCRRRTPVPRSGRFQLAVMVRLKDSTRNSAFALSSGIPVKSGRGIFTVVHTPRQ
jgi:hypothetical protein